MCKNDYFFYDLQSTTPHIGELSQSLSDGNNQLHKVIVLIKWYLSRMFAECCLLDFSLQEPKTEKLTISSYRF